ncbi:MAG TPA: hypothetical protein VGO68_19360 [Pyrinomonadaceae bacterium]|nr:hypothetical protein [Pyrinomonadaceae bacterium]
MSEVSSVGGSAGLDPGQRESASTFVRYYSVADRILGIKGVDEPVLNLAHDFLSGYYFKQTNLSATDQPVHLIEIHKSQPPVLSPAVSSFEIEDGRCFSTRDQITLEVNGSTIIIGPPQLRRTDIWLSESTAGRHPLALNNVILYAVQGALRRAGLYQFHAGCVVSKKAGGAILLVGDSGSGKSTLTATLLLNGWRFVSDDNLLLRESAAGIEAWALRRYFTFDQATLKACQLDVFAEAVGNRVPGKEEKLRFHARRAFPDQFVESCIPGAIVFPQITSKATSHLEPLKQADSLARLIRQCPWATCDAAAAPAHLQVLSKLARQTRSYTLFAGQDVFEQPASITELIAQQVEIL